MIEILPKSYNFYWKRYNKLFFKNSLRVTSHTHDSSRDIMHLKALSGELHCIYHWKDYECWLKEDWMDFQKEEIKTIIAKTT